MTEMTPNMAAAFKELQELKAPVFDREHDGTFVLSAEMNDDRIWADYFSGMEVDPEVGAIADKHSVWFEWENPGCLICFDM